MCSLWPVSDSCLLECGAGIYFFSAPNNRFISRFLKIPKICHMHEETNLSSCICIHIFLFSFIFFLFFVCLVICALCLLDIFVFLVILCGYSYYSFHISQYRSYHIIFIYWLVLIPNLTTEFLEAKVKNSILVIIYKQLFIFYLLPSVGYLSLNC